MLYTIYKGSHIFGLIVFRQNVMIFFPRNFGICRRGSVPPACKFSGKNITVLHGLAPSLILLKPVDRYVDLVLASGGPPIGLLVVVLMHVEQAQSLH